jgi:serine/threonine-protein kinase
MVLRADGAGEPLEVFSAHTNIVPWSFSPDGKRLAYWDTPPETRQDLWMLPIDWSDPDQPKAGKPEVFLKTPANEAAPAFSPDGRWIAYRSDESGIQEIYVRPSSGHGGQWQISNGGGLYPFWSSNQRELFYETTDYRIMVLDYTADSRSFFPGKSRVWSDKHLLRPGQLNLALHPDGKRFAVFPMPETRDEQGSLHATFLLNFFDELRRRVPVK